jgi:hypothetical protein
MLLLGLARCGIMPCCCCTASTSGPTLSPSSDAFPGPVWPRVEERCMVCGILLPVLCRRMACRAQCHSCGRRTCLKPNAGAGMKTGTNQYAVTPPSLCLHWSSWNTDGKSRSETNPASSTCPLQMQPGHALPTQEVRTQCGSTGLGWTHQAECVHPRAKATRRACKNMTHTHTSPSNTCAWRQVCCTCAPRLCAMPTITSICTAGRRAQQVY